MAEEIEIASLAKRLDRHLKDCTSVRKQTLVALRENSRAVNDISAVAQQMKEQVDAITTELETIKKLPISIIRWLLPIILAATITGLVSNWSAHEATVVAAKEAASAAQGVTAAVKASAHENRKISEQLNEMSGPTD